MWNNLLCISSLCFIYFAFQNTRIVKCFVGSVVGSDLGYQRKSCKSLRCRSWALQPSPSPPPGVISRSLSCFHGCKSQQTQPRLHSPSLTSHFPAFRHPRDFLGASPSDQARSVPCSGMPAGIFWQSSELLCSSESTASRGGESETQSCDCIPHPPNSVGISSIKRRKNFPLEMLPWCFPQSFLSSCCPQPQPPLLFVVKHLSLLLNN